MASFEPAITQLSPTDHQSLSNLHHFIRLYKSDPESATVVLDTGVTIALRILGKDIFRHLYAGKHDRLLRIILPAPASDPATASLSDLLARIPWEIARPSPGEPSLAEHNLRVCIVPATPVPPPALPPMRTDEALRILFVFAEAAGSLPLALRQERRALQALFRDQIEPTRNVVAHFLAHGVTRTQLAEQTHCHAGYHIVHWSGHGQHNLLELAAPDGTLDHISGAELLALLQHGSGRTPHLCFLSACDSGSSASIHNWEDFLSAPVTPPPPSGSASFTSTAQTLFAGGVPSVVAMRFAVGDAYARELALAFYTKLLTGKSSTSVATALAQARKQLQGKPHFSPCDHAAPLLFGAEQTGLTGRARRKQAHPPPSKYLPALGELAAQPNFVGRIRELASIGRELMHESAHKVALQITGIGGMGKTALAAEVVDAWQSRFDWVLLFQAKPHSIPLENCLRQIHMQLNATLGRYHQHCQRYPLDAIWREAASFASPAARWPALLQNLLRAMHAEAILLVLDNFETQLQAEPATDIQHWASQDEQWDQFLATLIPDLAHSRSRLLLTSRRPLAVLARQSLATHTRHLSLGPLPANEARLYLVQHPQLWQMLQDEYNEYVATQQNTAGPGDGPDQFLAHRLLQASRFHPLLMDRLARLTAPAHQPQLLQVLALLEARSSHAKLPALFVSVLDEAEWQQEQAYLQDALTDSIDLMLQQAGADARRLLWIIALGNEALEAGLLDGAWYGESMERQSLRELRQLLKTFDQLDPDLQARLKALPTEVYTDIANLPPPPPRPALPPLLAHLCQIGLIQQQDEQFDCHELVRERCLQWMDNHPEDCAELDETQIWQAFAERLLAAFEDLQYQNLARALQLGARGLVYCVQTHDFDLLASYANVMVTATTDPQYLTMLLPYLYDAVANVPSGRARWLCLATLGDALCRNEESVKSLDFYHQAYTQAQALAECGGPAAQQAWGDVAAIKTNLAIALREVGQLEAARLCLADCIEAGKLADSNPCELLTSEVELLVLTLLQAIDVPPEALQQLVQCRAQVANWWQQWLAVVPFDRPLPEPEKPPVPEAPDRETLARLYINVLNAISDAHFARQDWPAGQEVIEAVLSVKRQLQRPPDDIAGSLMDRANILRNLGQFHAAKAELEACHDLFAENPIAQLRVISSLGRVWHELGDAQQAIYQEQRVLARHEYLSDPVERAISHNNMANYLAALGGRAEQEQASCHLLAALVYRWVAELHQHCQITLDEYVIEFRRAEAQEKELVVPRISYLLHVPAFASLVKWLQSRRPDWDALQAELDVLLEVTRARAFASDNKALLPDN